MVHYPVPPHMQGRLRAFEIAAIFRFRLQKIWHENW